MYKRLIVTLICIIATSFYCTASAHGTFTWFGLKKDNTEIYVNTGSHPHHDCHGPKCHPKKPKHKPKPKPKHEHHKKGLGHYKCLWWCK